MDGPALSNRVDQKTERKLHAKVIATFLNSPTYASRMIGMGKPFTHKQQDIDIQVENITSGQWYSGIAEYNYDIPDTDITTSYSSCAYVLPVGSSMKDAFDNAGEGQTIDIDLNTIEKAKQQVMQDMGTRFWTASSSDQILSLEDIIDDGTVKSTIGGQTRSTYVELQSDVLDLASPADGKLTLTRMATQYDAACPQPGMMALEPNIMVTTKAIFTFYESLLMPQLRQQYGTLGVREPTMNGSMTKGEGARAGFRYLEFRGNPMLKDGFVGAGKLYFLNEEYIQYRGRTVVPDDYKALVKKVELGAPSTLEGTPDMPSSFNGFFYTPFFKIPGQTGLGYEYHVMGQNVPKAFNVHSKIINITGV